MKIGTLLLALFCLPLLNCKQNNENQFVFFLHNRFLEAHPITAEHPEFGRVHYHEIIAAFEANFLNVIPIITGTVTIKNMLMAILANEIF